MRCNSDGRISCEFSPALQEQHRDQNRSHNLLVAAASGRSSWATLMLKGQYGWLPG